MHSGMEVHTDDEFQIGQNVSRGFNCQPPSSGHIVVRKICCSDILCDNAEFSLLNELTKTFSSKFWTMSLVITLRISVNCGYFKCIKSVRFDDLVSD